MKKNIAIIGCGYWGKNLVRNFYELNSLYAICDVDEKKLKSFQGKYIPLKDNSIDTIFCLESFEHIMDSRTLIDEIYRILKDDGYLIIGTPNLASWFNRILLLLGIQPIATELSFKYSQCGRGFLKKFRKVDSISGHIRIMTLNGLMDLLYYHDFKIIKAKGEHYGALNEIKKYKLFVSFVKNLDNFFANYFPSLAHGIWILAEKK